jgi:hypothetical protein
VRPGVPVTVAGEYVPATQPADGGEPSSQTPPSTTQGANPR